MVVLSSDHFLESQQTRTEKLDVWVDNPPPDVAVDRVTISGKAKEASLTDACGSPRNLFLWTRDAEGHDSLQGLKEAGVGALDVSSTDSPFALKDSENSLRGQIVRTGVFLQEDGGAGTLQQLNVVV
jgi:hypothetical protein